MTGVLQPCNQMVVDTQSSNDGYVAESISSITNLHRSFTSNTQDIRKFDPAGGTESVKTENCMREVQQLLNVCKEEMNTRKLECTNDNIDAFCLALHPRFRPCTIAVCME